ncbi:MAG: DUF4331 family protein [Gemmatimonadaceae bacterium]
MKVRITRRDLIVPALAAGMLATVAGGTLMASDHQQTVVTEVNPRFDITDVWVFPGKPNRVSLLVTTSSPLSPAQTDTHAFGDISEELYQIKIDNNQDLQEDLVFQITFTGPRNAQIVTVRGPVAPNEVGNAAGTVHATLLTSPIVATGPVNTLLGSADGIQVFAGATEDPFFIDLEQFFRIVPDRKPAFAEPLASLPNEQNATSFREKPAPDFIAGFNGLSIAIEVPKELLTAGGSRPRFGVWATTSRNTAL